MITKSETATLLTLAAAYDQRTIGDADVEAWFAAAEVGRWSTQAVRRVIVEHYSRDSTRPRLGPATVSDRLRALRNQAAESFEAPKIPDPEPVDYPAWYRAQMAAHVDQQLERWASTGQEPDRALPTGTNRSLAEVIAGAPPHVRAQLEAAARKVGR